MKWLLPVRGEIARSIGHDARNLLYGLNVGLQTISEMHAHHLYEDMREVLQGTRSTFRDLYQLIDYFAELQGSLADVSTDLIPLLDCRDYIQGLARNHPLSHKCGLRVLISPKSEEPSIPKVVLRPLVMPLLANSFESIAECRSKSNKIVTVTLNQLDGQIGFRILVSDNSSGWKDQLDKVRHRILHRIPHSTKRDDRGTGLILLADLVRGLGGTLSITDNRTRGARVELRIPFPREMSLNGA